MAAIALPRIFGPLTGPIPTSYLDDNYNSIVNGLFSATGATSIIFLPGGASAVLRTVSDKLLDPVSVLDFMTAAQIADVRTHAATLALDAPIAAAILAAQTARQRLIFPAGTYMHASTLAFGGASNFIAEADGDVIFKHTGAGRAVTIDGGAVGGGIFNVGFLGFRIQGNATTTDALFVRACHHSQIRHRVTTACTTALRTNWCVGTEFWPVASSNEVAWTTVPTYGIFFDRRGAAEWTAYCEVWNPVIEGCNIGIELVGAAGCCFHGGTSEGNSYGVSIDAPGSGAQNNKFYGTDFEANSIQDVQISASNFNEFHGINSGSKFYIVSGVGNQIFGGTYANIRVDAGSLNSFIGAKYQSDGAGTFNDNVGNCKKVGVFNLNTQIFDPDTTGTSASLTQLAATTPAAGASPYRYTNAFNYPIDLTVTGGTVSNVTRKRAGIEVNQSVATNVTVRLAPGDSSNIVYTVVPTLAVWPA